MSYVYLGDLRNTPLGQASGSPEQIEKAATGLEATAASMRAQAMQGGPASTAFTSQAQALEAQAAQLRRVAAQRRGESTSVVPATAQTTGPNWLMIGGIGVGVLALVGVGAWALGRSNAAAPERSTAVMAMNKGKKKTKSKRKKSLVKCKHCGSALRPGLAASLRRSRICKDCNNPYAKLPANFVFVEGESGRIDNPNKSKKKRKKGEAAVVGKKRSGARVTDDDILKAWGFKSGQTVPGLYKKTKKSKAKKR